MTVFAQFFRNLYKGSEPKTDDVYGTGVWRQHRDRFNRAVDRFYTTARHLHEEATDHDVAKRIAALTHTLNELAGQVDECVRVLHARVPVNEQTIPASVRDKVGAVPELLSRAATKVAEAAQAAAMARVHVRASVQSGGGDTSAEVPGVSAAEQYVDDAKQLVDQCHIIASSIASSDKSK